ncbi:MAG TPA: hypothetical protein VM716_09510 [Gemmatimonadales bacterium]|nr:hypothetical protein [Gemmatimonadales bacterium]
MNLRWLAPLLSLGLPSATLAAQGNASPASPASPALPPRRTIAVGDTLRDSLTRKNVLLPADSTYAQEFRLAGRAGETVTIDLAADAFDAYVFLLGPGFDAAPPQDDDSGGHCNARLTVRLPRAADYIIVATSRERFAKGPFTLSVTAGPKPASLAPCNR